MILILLLIPFIVRIRFQILSQCITILIGKIEYSRLLLFYIHRA